jgi:hypothetical protein
MKRCPTCDQIVEDELDKRARNVFVFSFTTVTAWFFAFSIIEWNVPWWLTHPVVPTLLFGSTLATVLCWIRFLRAKRRPALPDMFEPVRAPPPPPSETPTTPPRRLQ